MANPKYSNNTTIRDAMQKYGVPQWKCAEIMGISEFTFTRKLRHELPESEQLRIVSLIEKYQRRGKKDE